MGLSTFGATWQDATSGRTCRANNCAQVAAEVGLFVFFRFDRLTHAAGRFGRSNSGLEVAQCATAQIGFRRAKLFVRAVQNAGHVTGVGLGFAVQQGAGTQFSARICNRLFVLIVKVVFHNEGVLRFDFDVVVIVFVVIQRGQFAQEVGFFFVRERAVSVEINVVRTIQRGEVELVCFGFVRFNLGCGELGHNAGLNNIRIVVGFVVVVCCGVIGPVLDLFGGLFGRCRSKRSGDYVLISFVSHRFDGAVVKRAVKFRTLQTDHTSAAQRGSLLRRCHIGNRSRLLRNGFSRRGVLTNRVLWFIKGHFGFGNRHIHRRDLSRRFFRGFNHRAKVKGLFGFGRMNVFDVVGFASRRFADHSADSLEFCGNAFGHRGRWGRLGCNLFCDLRGFDGRRHNRCHARRNGLWFCLSRFIRAIF